MDILRQHGRELVTETGFEANATVNLDAYIGLAPFPAISLELSGNVSVKAEPRVSSGSMTPSNSVLGIIVLPVRAPS